MSEHEEARIWAMHQAGHTPNEIARFIGCRPGEVQHVIERETSARHGDFQDRILSVQVRPEAMEQAEKAQRLTTTRRPMRMDGK